MRSKKSLYCFIVIGVKIDEVSMVGSNMLLEIHKRLQQIKDITCDTMFGGVSVLAVGDLYQLPPIGQPALFDKVTDSYAQLYKSGSLWVDGFEMIELNEIMRQKDDVRFTELLCRMRKAECTADDIDMIQLLVKQDILIYRSYQRNDQKQVASMLFLKLLLVLV